MVDESNPAYVLGASEPEVQAVLADSLRPGSVLYDIGANIGFFTLIAARIVGNEGHIFAFEPHSRARQVLLRNIESNGFMNVSVLPVAAGASRGHAQLAADSQHRHATAHLAHDGEPVEVVAIDDMIEGLRCPDVVKIDVEGAEVDVLRGLQGTMKRCAPQIVCEVHGANRQACMQVLLDHGYSVELLDEQTSGMLHLVGRVAT